MNYIISFELYVDSDEILSEEQIKKFLKDSMDNPAISVSNVKLIEVND